MMLLVGKERGPGGGNDCAPPLSMEPAVARLGLGLGLGSGL